MDARISEAYGLEVMDDCLSADIVNCTKVGDMDADIRADMRRQMAKATGEAASSPTDLCHWYLTELYWHLNLGFIMFYQRFAARFGIQTNTWQLLASMLAHSIFACFCRTLCCSPCRRFSPI